MAKWYRHRCVQLDFNKDVRLLRYSIQKYKFMRKNYLANYHVLHCSTNEDVVFLLLQLC